MVTSAVVKCFAIALLAVAMFASVGRAADAKPAKATKSPKTETLVAHGKYLVTTIGGCNDCHTPLKMGANGPEPDMSRMLSGHPASLVITAAPKLDDPWGWAGSNSMTAFAGPWGLSFAMNLTPDVETGIGAWTEQAFIGAMRSGKHMSTGRPILPPMPWQGIGQMTDADLKSIYAYLTTIPPIKNVVPAPIPPAPAK